MSEIINYSILFGATYQGFEEYKKNYIMRYGEVEANMQLVHIEIESKKLEENKNERSKNSLLKKL